MKKNEPQRRKEREGETKMQLTKNQEVIMQLAQKGYESYCAYTGWKSVITGDALPQWVDLPGEVKNAWFAAAVGMTIAIVAGKHS